MAGLQVSALTKKFGDRTVLNAVDLTVAAGTLTAILGPSGGGKTTFLRLVCGFERAGGGEIRLGERIVSAPGVHLPPELRRIGYVAQEGALFPHLSVAENIVFGLPRAQRKVQHRVAELLELVGLSANFAQRLPQQLSGGEQQRVALARALAPKPALVLLDEPFSALDAALRAETRQAVADALKIAGATAVLVTHDQAEALSMGNEVAVLWGSRMAQVASPQQLYRCPNTQDIAAFVGDAVWLDVANVSNSHVDTPLGALHVANSGSNQPARLLLRPEQISTTPANSSHDSATATVAGIRYLGAEAQLTLAVTDSPLTLIAKASAHAIPRTGDLLAVAVEGSVHAYDLTGARL